MQDDVAARIVATVADSYGVLVHSMRSATGRKDDADLAPVEWQFEYFAYREQITPASFTALKSRLQRVVERDDRRSDLWACLAQIYVDEYAFGFPGPDATSLDRALVAGRRAVELDRANQFALVALAQVHFFRAGPRGVWLRGRARDGAQSAQYRCRRDPGMADRAHARVRARHRDRASRDGAECQPRGMDALRSPLEPLPQGRIRAGPRVREPGRRARSFLALSRRGSIGLRSARAARRSRGRGAGSVGARSGVCGTRGSNIESWHFASGLSLPLLDGLRKAGLSIPASDGSSVSPSRAGTVTAKAERANSGTHSGAARAEEALGRGAAIQIRGANADLTALAEGLSEDIVTGLSRFSDPKVIARSSTSRLVNEAVDVRAAGRELGARYVMEGSLRHAGSRLRIAVQLVDAVSGAHLWAETYDRPLGAQEVFALQDDVVPRIVSTVADWYGVLPHSMSEALRSKETDQISPYEAVLRSFGYHERRTSEEHARTRADWSIGVQLAPGYADGWAVALDHSRRTVC